MTAQSYAKTKLDRLTWAYASPKVDFTMCKFLNQCFTVQGSWRALLHFGILANATYMYSKFSHKMCLLWWKRREKSDIRKTCLYNFAPLKPHFFVVKLRFTGVYIIFLISAQNIDCGYSLEPPRWGGSNEYSQSMFWAEIWKISEFLSENFQFLVVKFSIYLNRHVFVMKFVQSP